MTSRTLLVGCGPIVSGDIAQPLVEADSILIEGSRIAELGHGIDRDSADTVIDVKGCAVAPGLIDSHAHPVIGDFTPRQNTLGWTKRVVHGAVSTLISAGETHWPGRLKDGPEAVAVCAAAYLTSRSLSPDSARVYGGALILDRGISTTDLDDLHRLGVRMLGEIGLGSEKDLAEIAALVAHARSLGWVAPLHFGGASVPGSSVVDLEMAVAVKPSILSHANGGPTARPTEEALELIASTDAAIEIVFAGNLKAATRIVTHLLETGEIERLQWGTDTPSGTGVVPLGMLRLLTEVVSFTGISPEVAWCTATGGTAARYGHHDLGRVRVGAKADLAILDNPLGGVADDAFGSMRAGNIPAVAGMFVDGELVVRKSAATPPPVRQFD